ncbi:outer membrane receptor protein involved in Fe transport [Povalibacter uvarum]|uniref:Outer membrane receptor protein involved in Fe transport n=1 Tax=Povalibacter uvarum TaxID=732238 RepID=A0A841HVE5_9GAMM|nr:TonB-dependent receptor [Povalibacter uvarum]MBB6095908.1 outer membrane receptor protein involved in Fe transport [Povalibacter uvarum]
MSNTSHRWRSPLRALLLSVLAASAAHAQDENIQEIVVTGSRIAAPNLTSTSPVQVVSSKEIQQTGRTDVVEILNQLPQVIQNSAVDFSNTSNSLSTPGGLTTVNLRGVGPQRTLVLVDGKRLGSADANTANPNPSANLDQIPMSLVERVDVVTGGASAVYGSDAIAGVVNFIMKKDFEGLNIDAQYNVFQRDNDNGFMQGLARERGMTVSDGSTNDGDTFTVSITAGANIADGRGNVTGYLTYRTADPITGADIDFAGCQLVLNSDGTPRCGGSANSNRFSPAGTTAQYAVVGNQFVPWGLGVDSTPPPEFNSNTYVNMYRDNERYMGGFMAHVTMNDYFEPYVEFNFMNDRTRVEIAPSGLFENSNPYNGSGFYSINCSNPLLSAQQRSILCTPAQIAADTANPGSTSVDVNIGRRNIEGGPRIAEFEHDNYRAVVGTRGNLTDAWNYDAYGQYYYTSLYNLNTSYLNFQAIADALQVTGTPGSPTCISGNAGCVPFNIFSEGGVTPEQLAYLYTDGTAYGTVTQKIAHADITGDLGLYGLKLPTADTGIGVNVGFEYRSEDLAFKPDAAELSGNLAGFAGASVAINDGYNVREAFTELRVPLVQGRTAIYDLVFDAGYRFSDYSTAGETNTYKFELQYAPIEDLRFRGSYQHAIRAPNIIELFNPQNYGQQSFLGIDPCARQPDGSPATRSLDDCMRTGVTAAQYGNGGSTNTIPQCVSNQCGQVTGGNPELDPELADTYSVGLTWAPGALGLVASLDYYSIEVEDAVGAIPGAFLFQQCLDTGNPEFCSQIVRTGAGALTGASVQTGGYILQTGVNVGELTLKGVDAQISYSLPIGDIGSLSFALNGAYVLEAGNTPLPEADQSYDCAGLFGTICQTITPEWRHNLRMSWETPWDLDLSLNWRFINGVDLDANQSDPDLNPTGDFDSFNAHMPSVSYFDLSALWSVGTGTTLRAGINNIFDKDPPLISTNVSGTGGPNSYPTYDILGRQAFFGFSQKF